MTVFEKYQQWLNYAGLDEASRAELLAMEGDEKAIKDAFYAPLSFGTAGLRGIMGAGLNRMNIYTVAWATKGLALYIAENGKEACEKGCAIAYDSRNNSPLFARISAEVLAAEGIKVYLFDELRPTPELSFAIRRNGYFAGINITASHNPKEYNGYKVYGADGAQLSPAAASKVSAYIDSLDIFNDVKRADYDEAIASGMITILDKGEDEYFLNQILSCAINPDAVKKAADDFKVIYTPLHGSGYRLVPEVLRRMGLKHILCVEEQMVIDGNFPTVASPNPENREGFTIAIEMAKQNDVDLIIGTDPDADRAGTAVRNREGEYVTLTGNQMGVLLLEYIIHCRKELGTLAPKALAITSNVSTRMTEAVAKENGVVMDYCFTGFRFIADRMNRYIADGYQFLLGFEESYGYLMGDYARDKDAVGAAAMIAEMAAYYHLQGKTLYDVMMECYEKYGYYSELTMNLVMPGLDGLEKMQKLMKMLHEDPPKSFAGFGVVSVANHLTGKKKTGDLVEDLPEHLIGSNVIAFTLDNGAELIIRPSGTEPKIKVYIMVKVDSMEKAEEIKASLSSAVKALAE
ncbi:MAG: phospho-sugar mutase [Clostridia bacterium]|nr:phospho-sugar mutase [Clostridia bacterium]